MIDINAMVGYWPFNRLPARTPEEMETYLKSAGITRACVYAPEAVFYPDPHVANKELLSALRQYPFFVPSAVVDPTLGNWREVFDELHTQWQVSLIRLFPNYHEYRIHEKVGTEALDYAGKLGMTVAVHMRMRDERSHHPLMKVPGVLLDDVITAANIQPATRILLCCPLWTEARQFLIKTKDAGNGYVEISHSEICCTIEHLLEATTPDRVLFGTHAPLYYPHAAVAKVNDAVGVLTKPQIDDIIQGNAQALLRM